MVSGEEANIECLMDIGFDLPCAQIWHYNTENTREICLEALTHITTLVAHTTPVFNAMKTTAVLSLRQSPVEHGEILAYHQPSVGVSRRVSGLFGIWNVGPFSLLPKRSTDYHAHTSAV